MFRPALAAAAVAVLAVASLAGCSMSPRVAAPASDGRAKQTTTPVPETTSPQDEPAAPVSDAVPFAAITSAANCIYAPDELTAAYSSWSNYVAGAGVPDTVHPQTACEYAHADPALQYVAEPFTIWVTAYSYTDPDLAVRAGYDDVPAPEGLNRAAIADYYCLPDGEQPADVTFAITCEESAEATIIVFGDTYARVVRDDIIWDIAASGATAAVEAPELDSMLRIARLAAERTI